MSQFENLCYHLLPEFLHILKKTERSLSVIADQIEKDAEWERKQNAYLSGNEEDESE